MKGQDYVRSISILLCFVVTVSLTGRTSDRFSLSKSAGIKSTAAGLTLSGYVPAGRSGFLHLTFDEDTPRFVRDQAGNFATADANYVRSEKPKIAGKSSAFFNRRESVIRLKPNRNVWPVTDTDPGEFYLSFWFQPVHLYERNSLFRFVVPGELHGAGLIMEIRHGRLVLEGRNLIVDKEGVRSDIHLVSRKIIKKDQWYHILLQYRKDLPGFALSIDGKEDSVIRLKSADSVISFPENIRPEIVLGNPLSGRLDELVMGNGSLDRERISQLASVYGSASYDDRSGRIYQQEGSAYSEVITMKDTMKGGSVSYNAKEPPGTIVVVRYRASDRKFHSETPEHLLPFRIVPEGKSVKLPPFRYIQWKTEMKADPEGEVSPHLLSVNVAGESYKMPVRSARPEVIHELSDENRFCIQWRKNPELSVEKTGGYVILIGARRNEFIARIDRKGSQPIRKSTTSFPLTEQEKQIQKKRPQEIQRLKQNHIRYCINQNVMNEAILLDPEKERLPYIEAMRSYYIATGAYIRSPDHSADSDTIIHTIRPDR